MIFYILAPESYAFNPTAVSVAIGAIIIFILGGIVAVRERTSRVGLIFLILIIVEQLYYIGLIGNYLAKEPQVAFWWQHISITGLLIEPAVVYRLCASMNPTYYSNRFLSISIDFTCVLLVFTHLSTDLFLGEPYHYPWGYFMHWKPATIIYLIYYSVISIYSLLPFVLLMHDRTASPTQRDRARWLLGGWAISIFAFIDLLPAHGFSIYPTAHFFISLTMMVTAYVALRFRLVDITPAYAARRIIDTMHDAIIVADKDRYVRLINKAACDMLEFKVEEILHHPVPETLERAISPDALEALLRGEERQNMEIVYTQKSTGQAINISISVLPMKDSNGLTEAYLGLLRNISEQRAAEKKAHQLANYDELTKLPNRNQLYAQLTALVSEGTRHSFNITVLLIDLDQFKRVNDGYGHSTGDLLLQEATQRMQQCLRVQDARHPSHFREIEATLARLGGDEFVITLYRTQSDLEVAQLAQRIIQSFSQPMLLQDHEIHIGASIGISRFPLDSQDVESLLRNADAAMYHAKARGRNTYQYFDEKMNSILQRRLTVETDLRKALSHGELVVYYQPQVDIHTGSIEGLEALIRWRHPERGLISPAEFIPVAEETGLIVPIGNYVLQTACNQVKTWHLEGYHPMRIAVNLSGRQFHQAGLINTVKQALADSGLDPHYLELEITESILMQDVEEIATTLRAIRNMGVLLSIDDFGTGYSSLSYLKRFPVTCVKIDGSFIRNIPQDLGDIGLVQAIIAMARSLELEVVAEGVEKQEQLFFLQNNYQGLAQGYLFAKPMPASEVKRYFLKEPSR